MSITYYRWTKAEDQSLRLYWSAGQTSTAIAKLMPYRTRMSVMGRVHRLKLERRAYPTGKGPQTLFVASNVSRDPCVRCGVRGDIGCKHRRAG